MAGIKISDLQTASTLENDDKLILARPGLGNGQTLNIPGSIFGKAADVANLSTNKVDKNDDIAVGTYTKITYDKKGLVTSGSSLAASDIPTGINAANIANGTVSNAEFQCLSSVTSDIQTQLNNLNSIISNLGKTWADFKCS